MPGRKQHIGGARFRKWRQTVETAPESPFALSRAKKDLIVNIHTARAGHSLCQQAPLYNDLQGAMAIPPVICGLQASRLCLRAEKRSKRRFYREKTTATLLFTRVSGRLTFKTMSAREYAERVQ